MKFELLKEKGLRLRLKVSLHQSGECRLALTEQHT